MLRSEALRHLRGPLRAQADERAVEVKIIHLERENAGRPKETVLVDLNYGSNCGRASFDEDDAILLTSRVRSGNLVADEACAKLRPAANARSTGVPWEGEVFRRRTWVRHGWFAILPEPAGQNWNC